MKIAAHPLVVAVALGLLPPTALADELNDPQVALEASADDLADMDAPSEAEMLRAEREWRMAREQLG